jgi:hypothetical protein
LFRCSRGRRKRKSDVGGGRVEAPEAPPSRRPDCCEVAVNQPGAPSQARPTVAPAPRNRPASHGSRPPRSPPTRLPRSSRADPERHTPRAQGADDGSFDRAGEAKLRNHGPAPSPPSLGDMPPTPALRPASRRDGGAASRHSQPGRGGQSTIAPSARRSPPTPTRLQPQRPRPRAHSQFGRSPQPDRPHGEAMSKRRRRRSPARDYLYIC